MKMMMGDDGHDVPGDDDGDAIENDDTDGDDKDDWIDNDDNADVER